MVRMIAVSRRGGAITGLVRKPAAGRHQLRAGYGRLLPRDGSRRVPGVGRRPDPQLRVEDVDPEYRRLVGDAGLEPRLELRSEAVAQRHFILADPSAGIVGLSERWREEGLGRVRCELAKQPSAPTVFARGTAGWPGPRRDPDRFSWSMAGDCVA
jgi:hypothetical protein